MCCFARARNDTRRLPLQCQPRVIERISLGKHTCRRSLALLSCLGLTHYLEQNGSGAARERGRSIERAEDREQGSWP